MTTFENWWSTRKALIFYVSMAVVALVLTACAGGFKTVDAKGVSNKVTVHAVACQNGQPLSDEYDVPRFPLQIADSNSIIGFMESLDPEVQAIVNSASSMGPPYIVGLVDFTLVNLTPNQTMGAGANSILRFRGTIDGGCTAAMQIDTDNAQLYLDTTQYQPMLTGTWTVTTDSGSPITVSIQAAITAMTNGVTLSRYTLDGVLTANLNGAQVEMGTFSIPLESVMEDTTWLNNLGNGGF